VTLTVKLTDTGLAEGGEIWLSSGGAAWWGSSRWTGMMVATIMLLIIMVTWTIV